MMADHRVTLFAALSGPTRRAVIPRLGRGPAMAGELHAPHDIARPTFPRHLKVLEASGLVRSEKSGRVRTVHVEAAPMAAARDWLERQRALWEGRLDRLDALATDLDDH